MGKIIIINYIIFVAKGLNTIDGFVLVLKALILKEKLT